MKGIFTCRGQPQKTPARHITTMSLIQNFTATRVNRICYKGLKESPTLVKSAIVSTTYHEYTVPIGRASKRDLIEVYRSTPVCVPDAMYMQMIADNINRRGLNSIPSRLNSREVLVVYSWLCRLGRETQPESNPCCDDE